MRFLRNLYWRSFGRDRLSGDEPAPGPVVDSRHRMRLVLAGFVVLLAVVFGRAVELDVTEGPAFRAEAAKPLVRRDSLPGVRGRILARDGTVLACDKKVLALAVHYRWLENPPNPRWLRSMARSRLSRADRKKSDRVVAEEARVRAERVELAQRLARLSGLSGDEWARRAAQVQARVERIAESVNRHHQAEADRGEARGVSDTAESAPPASRLRRMLAWAVDVLRASMDEPPERITVAEELDYHVIVEDVSLALAAEVEAAPGRYPGVKIVLRPRRAYPEGRLAAHVLGHLGPVAREELGEPDAPDAYCPEDRVGRTGLELRYEDLLRARRGESVELTDRSGRVLSSYRQREPGVGRDLVLTLDPQLQHACERLLEGALQRRAILTPDAEPAGGAIVVLDAHTGAILAAASAPAFDPNQFAGDGRGDVAALLSDPAHPLFDRAVKMAIPPGSVFKPVAAAALLEAGGVVPDEKLLCRGYLDDPGRWRCAIYSRHGVGHGEVTLVDALVESCNVYFFHYAGLVGPDPLVAWASRFGFGRPTGVDLPGESPGTLPTPTTIRKLQGHAWRAGDTRLLAIGQGALEATPVQIARMMAAIANGGILVTPHVVSGLGLPALDDGRSASELAELSDDPIRLTPPRPIPGLSERTLATIREGLDRVVSDPRGTAHGTVYLDSVAIAGKTGTAQAGPGRADHAWFAGYVPAEKPRLAFVVVLEHAGDAAEAAGPVAQRLVRQMHELGYFTTRRLRTAAHLPASARRNTGMK